ncbi:eukaryotic translation initiation factor 5B-like [Camellia sinensis]|uniref:eukaryotic translation initiation factor 5B-like n=1 Tax=Camellia sinensis TaxID=4442 RepID=UPI0010366709|nr:eukaryotic translation initiation factor 5B-like [Camellia sinensis]
MESHLEQIANILDREEKTVSYFPIENSFGESLARFDFDDSDIDESLSPHFRESHFSSIEDNPLLTLSFSPCVEVPHLELEPLPSDCTDEILDRVETISMDTPPPVYPVPKKIMSELCAIQHVHSFSIQSFENRKEFADKKREVSSLQKANKSLQSKMKTLEDQAEDAIKAQNDAEERAESAEAIKKVLEAEKKEAEEKMAEAQKELQDALATKDAELKAADEKGYNEGVADATADYEKQVKQGEEVPKDITPEKASSDAPFADKSLDETLQEIDAELAAEKAAEISSQQSSEVQTQPSAAAEES